MSEPTQAKPTGEIIQHYQRSAHFRVVHGDGVFGGLSPAGQLRMIFYNEGQRIPESITLERITEESGQVRMGKEISRTGQKGFLRELEVDIVLSLKAARSVHAWLGRQIVEMEKRQSKANPPQ